MIRIEEKFCPVSRPERVIQFGTGAFLRGFVDWMLQKMNDQGLFCGNAVVVQSTPRGIAPQLAAQKGLYTQVLRGAEGEEARVIDVLSRCIDLNSDSDAYFALAQQKELRFIVSNTTEAGIEFCPEDRLEGFPNITFPAKLTALLYRRVQAGLEGFWILPCELIDRNGEKLKEAVLSYAALWELEEDFSRWVCEKNRFCCTLVDRIVTGFPREDPPRLEWQDDILNVSEFYHLWVIEASGDLEREFPLIRSGLNVILTENSEPYRTRKVRILNGAHTVMTSYGLLWGFDTVKECMDHEKMRDFVRGALTEEILPTLSLPREELLSYTESILCRFSNPYLKHRLSSISLNSVSKFKVRVLPSILGYYEKTGCLPKNLICAFGFLIRLYRERTMPDDERICRMMREGTVKDVLANKALWGRDCSFMTEEVLPYVEVSR